MITGILIAAYSSIVIGHLITCSKAENNFKGNLSIIVMTLAALCSGDTMSGF